MSENQEEIDLRRLALLLAVVLVVAACGGDSGGELDAGSETTQAAPGETTPDATPAPAEGDDDSDQDEPSDTEGSGPSTATVTLGDETYEFSSEGAVVAQCLTDLFGIFSVQLPSVDGEGSVQIVALREGTDPEEVGEVNSISVDVGDDDWVADEADTTFTESDVVEPGMSQVDSVEIDGSTVRGSASFVRLNSVFGGGDVETATGTFEATCGEERTS